MSGMTWVVLVTAEDGSQSIVGTQSGRPFTSDARAQRLAATLQNEGQLAYVLPIEASEASEVSS